MKKILFALIFILIGGACYAGATNNIENAIDGYGRALNITIDTRIGSTANYKSYASSVTSSVIYDLESALGRYCSAGYLKNDSSNTITVNISINGSTYGDSIYVYANEIFDFNIFQIFKKIKINSAATSNFRLVVR